MLKGDNFVILSEEEVTTICNFFDNPGVRKKTLYQELIKTGMYDIHNNMKKFLRKNDED